MNGLNPLFLVHYAVDYMYMWVITCMYMYIAHDWHTTSDNSNGTNTYCTHLLYIEHFHLQSYM